MYVAARFSRVRTLAVYAVSNEIAMGMFEAAARQSQPFARLRDGQVQYFTCHIRCDARMDVNYHPSTAAQYVCVVRVLEKCEGDVANCHKPSIGGVRVIEKMPILTLRPATDDDKNHPPLRRERIVRILCAAGACKDGAEEAVNEFWREDG